MYLAFTRCLIEIFFFFIAILYNYCNSQRELHHKKISGRHSPPTRLVPDKPPKVSQQQPKQQLTSRQQNKPTQPQARPSQQQPGTTLGRLGKKKVQAKIDTGLRRRKREEQEEVKGRDDDLEQNKENLREGRSPVSSIFFRLYNSPMLIYVASYLYKSGVGGGGEES